MANFGDLGLTVKSAEYRPCTVDGKKGLFHRWVESDKIFLHFADLSRFSSETNDRLKELYNRNILIDGHTYIQTVKTFFGLVEFADGTVEKVDPEKIVFNDSERKFKEVN